MIQLLSKYKSYILSLLLSLGVCFSVYTYAAEPSRTLGFQGQFYTYNTPGNNPVNATFTFYDSVTGGNVTGTPISKIIQVVNGYFGTTFTESETTGVDLNQQLYLEISINGTTLSPRTTVNPTVSSLKSFGTFSYAVAPTVGPSGSLYFNTTTNELYASNGSTWQLAGVSSSTTQWFNNGTDLYFTTGNVGVGTSNPVGKFEVSSGSSSISAGDFVVDTNNKTVYVGRLSSVSGDNSSFYVRNRLGINYFGVDGISSGSFAARMAIGTTSPSSAVLLVTSSLAAPAIFERNTTGSLSIQLKNNIGSMFAGIQAGTNNFGISTTNDLALGSVFTVTSSGTVGIGTTSPESLLQMRGSSPVLTITDSRNTTYTVGDQLSAVNFTSDDASNSLQGQTRARISVLQGDTFGAVQNMGFSTYSDSGALTEHLRIMYNGRVGIGTSSPMSKLNVSIANGASVNDGLMINRSGSASGVGLKHISSSGGIYRSSLTSLFGGTESEILTFGYNGSTNVGIGTTTPGTTLTIGAGQITIPNGSGSLPSYSFSNGSNDGMYLSAPGQLSFGTAGGERLRINSSNLSYQAAASGFAIQLGGTTGTFPVFIPNRSDTTTGIGANQTGVLSFITGGTEKMTVSNGGNVGIGTTTPSAKLDIWGNLQVGTSSVPALSVNTALGIIGVNATNPTARLTVDAIGSTPADVVQGRAVGGGVVRWQLSMTASQPHFFVGSNLGIGTTTPGNRPLYIESASASDNGNSAIVISNTNTGFAGVDLYQGAASAGFIRFYNSTYPGTIGVANALRLGTDVAGGQVSIASGANVEAIRITSGGNVAIGTSTPLAKFHIQGGSATTYLTSDGSGISSIGSGTTRYELVANGSTYGLNSTAAVDGGVLRLSFGSASSYISGAQQGGAYMNFFVNSTSSPKMSILNNGNVGIGTTTPSTSLQVVGNMLLGAGTSASRLSLGSSGAMNNANSRIAVFENGSTANYFYGMGLAGVSGGEGLGLWGGTDSSIPYTGTSGTLAHLFIQKISGNVGIGTTTPGNKLTVAGAINSTDLLGGITTLSVDASGNIIRTPSDSKLKTNVETLTSALDKVNQMRGVSYNWIDTNRFGTSTEIGFIAQELETIVPEVVKSGGEYKSVNYQNLTALLTEAIKELSAKVTGFGEKFTTKQLCLEDVCINKDQLRTLLQQSMNQQSTYVPPVPSTPDEKPTEEPTTPPTDEPAPDPVVTPPADEVAAQ